MPLIHRIAMTIERELYDGTITLDVDVAYVFEEASGGSWRDEPPSNAYADVLDVLVKDTAVNITADLSRVELRAISDRIVELIEDAL